MCRNASLSAHKSVGSQLKIGCVKYLNARPLIYGWNGAVDFDHPAALCCKLEAGELDAALVSSIEFLQRPEYSIVDSVAIAADGPVYSVFVAHDVPLEEVSRIELDPASKTSVTLFRVLWAQRSLSLPKSAGCQPAASGSLLDANAENSGQTVRNDGLTAHAPRNKDSARLLIGDQAIRFRQKNPELHYWDLAEEWKKITGMPFVFALWLIRQDLENAGEIANQLRGLRDRNLAKLEQVIAATDNFDHEFCRQYFRENLVYDFGERQKAGLREFHRRCLGCGIDVAPTFELKVV